MAKDPFIDTNDVVRYSAYVANGTFDHDLTIADRIDVIRLLSFAIGRIYRPGQWRSTTHRDTLLEAMGYCPGVTTLVAFERASNIIKHLTPAILNKGN